MKKIVKSFGSAANFAIILMTLSVVIQIFINKLYPLNILQMTFLKENETVHNAVLISSLVLLFFGGNFATLAYQAFTQALSAKGEVKKLVTSGPFALIRHPFYLSIIIICFSLVFLLNSYFVLISAIITTVLLIKEAKIEEEYLEEKFGKEYKKYKETSGMFLPKVG